MAPADVVGTKGHHVVRHRPAQRRVLRCSDDDEAVFQSKKRRLDHRQSTDGQRNLPDPALGEVPSAVFVAKGLGSWANGHV